MYVESLFSGSFKVVKLAMSGVCGSLTSHTTIVTFLVVYIIQFCDLLFAQAAHNSRNSHIKMLN